MEYDKVTNRGGAKMSYPRQGKVKETVKFTKFDSPEEYANYVSKCTHVQCAQSNRTDNFLGIGFQNSIDTLVCGTKNYITEAQGIINKMAEENVFSLHQPVLESSIVGFLPNIGNYLAGQPNDMFNIVQSEEQSITTPLTIYVETLVSSGVSHKQLIARGIAVLGFVLAMNAIRPVEVYTVCIAAPSGGNGGIVCRIPSKPIDIERAAFMLCDPAYYRRLAFAAMCDHVNTSNSNYIAWPWQGDPTQEEYSRCMRELLDMQPEDVFIPGGYLFDNLMLTNPVQWVKNMIAKHRGNVN